MKTCSKCNIEKLESEFNKKKNALQAFCKLCNSQSLKEHYKKNKEYYLSKSRTVKNRTKKWLLDFLSDKHCVDCGVANPIVLTFDHKDPKTKEICIARAHSYSLKKLQQEIIKCEIICANCHAIRTAKMFGWYKFKSGFEYTKLSNK